jgi:hypothetical protein
MSGQAASYHINIIIDSCLISYWHMSCLSSVVPGQAHQGYWNATYFHIRTLKHLIPAPGHGNFRVIGR